MTLHFEKKSDSDTDLDTSLLFLVIVHCNFRSCDWPSIDENIIKRSNQVLFQHACDSLP